MKLMIKEVCAHYHEVEFDDDVDMEELTEKIREECNITNDCREAVERISNEYYSVGIDSVFKPNNAGTDVLWLEFEKEDES